MKIETTEREKGRLEQTQTDYQQAQVLLQQAQLRLEIAKEQMGTVVRSVLEAHEQSPNGVAWTLLADLSLESADAQKPNRAERRRNPKTQSKEAE